MGSSRYGAAVSHNGRMAAHPSSSAPIVPDDIASEDTPDGTGHGKRAATRLIYGAMALGGSWHDATVTDDDLAVASAALDTAVEVGMREIDLADIYTLGKSETVVGQWLAEHPGTREQLLLQTKAGIRIPGITASPEDPVHYRLDKSTLRGGLEGSLERLGVDAVDRFLIHRWDPLADPAAVATVLDELIDDGLTAGVGISNVSWYRLNLLQRHLQHPIQAVQVQLSLGHRDFVERQILWDHPEAAAVDFSEELLDECAATGIEIQAWGSLDQGRFTRKNTDAEHATTAALVQEIADDIGCSAEAVALAWIMRLPQRIRPVIGTTNPARIRACAQAETAARALTHEHWYALLNSARGSNIP